MTFHDQLIHVLVIDDDEQHLTLMDRALHDAVPEGAHGPAFDVLCHADPAEGLAAMPAEGPVVIVCDYSMPGGTGLDWLPDFLRLDRGPVLIMTGHGDEQIAARAFRAGASDYLVKSQVLEHPDLLRRAIGEAWRRHKLEHRNRDLTRQLKLANEVLEAKNRKLRGMTETAHRFVDDVAHDLRTPLTVIGEFASIIMDGLDGPVTDAQSEHLGVIHSATRELAHMVDDFLDSSKLRAGCLRVDRRPHTVAEIFTAVGPMLRTRAAGGEIRLVEECANDLPSVFADQEKVRRILVNLTQNAIKFSPRGGEISLWARRQANGEGVEIGVTDHGPGMPPETVRVIFDRFRQAEEGESASVKGFGLGLAIVSELTALNLGEVSVTSAVGVGSTFSFTLPANVPGVIASRVIDRLGDRPLSILEATPAATHELPADAEGDPTDRLETLRSALAGLCYPTDVVLVVPETERVIMLGGTGEPDLWIARLKKIAETLPGHDPASGVGGIDLQCAGRWWSATRHRDDVMHTLEHHCAGTTADLAA
ncbi:MAG: hybrid sensor histidine kinase/response regulator [Phycisphaerales bacterium]|nr:hybrid sensor histidine kinase/response regulator [Phycisphaerae bacterium]NNF41883.1 hybrid sensor histidine kinase/response regulator [Phycisphaerales bacterium]NNM25101.1 hybrid sensor histidine kinase/response regulator [Phycisphaerales bacterium]